MTGTLTATQQQAAQLPPGEHQYMRTILERGLPEAKVLKLLRQASIRGHVRATMTLARMEDKRGNEEETIRLYRQMADQGHTGAMDMLGHKILKQDPQQALRLWNEAATLGYVGGLNSLANVYFRGIAGQKKDLDMAVWLWQQSVEQKNSTAMIALANLHETGEGIEQDLDKAVNLYKTATKGSPLSVRLQLERLLTKIQDRKSFTLTDGANMHFKAHQNLTGRIANILKTLPTSPKPAAQPAAAPASAAA